MTVRTAAGTDCNTHDFYTVSSEPIKIPIIRPVICLPTELKAITPKQFKEVQFKQCGDNDDDDIR
jgi:hypothetical protein